MGVMDNLNTMVKKKQSGIAQNAVTNHSYTQGKSRVQGNQGVSQGNQGWKSQHTNTGGYGKQINPIISSLSKAPTYEAPKITESLLTQGGFNQALGVVGARNNAKLKSQNQRVLQSVLGSLVSGDSQNRAIGARQQIAGMQDATDRRGQDFTAEAKAEATAQAGVRDANTKGYYDNQNDLGVERIRISNEKLNNPTPKAVNPLDEKIKRQKIIKNGYFSGGDFDTLSEEAQQQVTQKYLQTGEEPTGYKQTGGNDNLWDNREYEATYGETQQPSTPTEQPQGQPKQEAFKLDTKQSNALLIKIAEDEGYAISDLSIKDGKVVSPDGNLSLEIAHGAYYGNI